MDRFAWCDGALAPDEQTVLEQSGVRLYDGDDKTQFDHGRMTLTSHRTIWKDHKDKRYTMSLALAHVIFVEQQPGSITKSHKIIVHLSPPEAYKPPGPVTSSRFHFVRLSFKDGGQPEFFTALQEQLAMKRWLQQAPQAPSAVPGAPAGAQKKQLRTGIMGIERNLEQKHKETDKNITVAFEDLSKLMDKAKEMVMLSKNISNKIKEKQGDITEDETVRFKSYLMSLGIDDPVTRESHGTGDKYFRELARQVSSAMEQPLKECGGMMTLTDVYCRVNRARGMELLSPEDLVNACKLMEKLQLPVRLRVFDSGVMVLQSMTHSEEQIIRNTLQLVEDNTSVTAEELSKLIGLSVVLSKERLLVTEKVGKLCRDEDVEGLRFYPNLFLTKPVS